MPSIRRQHFHRQPLSLPPPPDGVPAPSVRKFPVGGLEALHVFAVVVRAGLALDQALDVGVPRATVPVRAVEERRRECASGRSIVVPLAQHVLRPKMKQKGRAGGFWPIFHVALLATRGEPRSSYRSLG